MRVSGAHDCAQQRLFFGLGSTVRSAWVSSARRRCEETTWYSGHRWVVEVGFLGVDTGRRGATAAIHVAASQDVGECYSCDERGCTD